jgi:NAD-dependent dihydropyrimidine dehydrogenase PreA subunit
MHCNEPACASACLVGALKKTPEGAVVYNKDICLGCRYCMIACPFNVPAYEYHDAFAPQVCKCDLCHERFITDHEPPACVSICPQEVMVFGKRDDLIDLARERIALHPEKYQDHIYGINEAGGTSWLYLSEVPFEDLGFPMDLGTKPYPEYTRGFLSMVPGVLILWPALLGGFHAFMKSREKAAGQEATPSPAELGSVDPEE